MTMNVGISVVTSGMNSEIANITVITIRPRKRIFAITRPPLMHSIHCRPTAQTVKITEFRKLRSLNHLGDSGERVGVVAEMQRVRDHLRRLDRELLVRHKDPATM